MKSILTTSMHRRALLKSLALTPAVLAAPPILRSAYAESIIRIADGGGDYAAAATKAYYEPFFKETGIRVVPVERQDTPVAEVRAIVETGAYKWDMAAQIGQDVATTLAEGGYLEKLDLSGPDAAEIPDSMKNEHYIATEILAFMMAYRKDRFDEPLTSYADIWNVEKFPGRRGIRKMARDAIMVALAADGVAPQDIPTVLSDEAGWARAFAKLDAIKDNVAVWWSSAAQTTNFLRTGELDICPTFNTRAQFVADSGTPVGLVWKGGYFNAFGVLIPKGSPAADLARRFVTFCLNPERMAALCSEFALGPTHPGALQYIAEERAKLLPSHPDNLSQMGQLDYRFWGPRQEEANTRFNEWLLQ